MHCTAGAQLLLSSLLLSSLELSDTTIYEPYIRALLAAPDGAGDRGQGVGQGLNPEP